MKNLKFVVFHRVPLGDGSGHTDHALAAFDRLIEAFAERRLLMSMNPGDLIMIREELDGAVIRVLNIDPKPTEGGQNG